MEDHNAFCAFMAVLIVLVAAIATMGCVENNASQQGSGTLVPIYEGSQYAGTQTAPTATETQYIQDAGSQPVNAQNDGARPQGNSSKASGMQNNSQVQQAAVDACAGKAVGDTCTLSFRNASEPNPGFNRTRGGSSPAGASGPQGMPAAGNGNMTAPQDGMQQPTGTCEASDSSGVLSCKMAMPAGMPSGFGG
jgi:hypothetical protein